MTEMEYWEEYDAIHNAKSEADANRRLNQLADSRKGKDAKPTRV